eukprot:m.97054 g.97054  ORF g.97054 m.97054 type:complete len:605 (+) comp18507_c0_seq1:2-1816(+)
MNLRLFLGEGHQPLEVQIASPEALHQECVRLQLVPPQAPIQQLQILAFREQAWVSVAFEALLENDVIQLIMTAAPTNPKFVKRITEDLENPLARDAWCVPARYEDIQVVSQGSFGRVARAFDSLSETPAQWFYQDNGWVHMAQSDTDLNNAVAQNENHCLIDGGEYVVDLKRMLRFALVQGTVISDSAVSVRRFNVAIKHFLNPFHDEKFAKRTFREIKLLKHLNQEGVFNDESNIVQLLDWFTPQLSAQALEDVFLVMELAPMPLARIMRQNLSNEQICWVVFQILAGLKYIHSAGVIHRDLKPDNIICWENLEIRIVDFGLARASHEHRHTPYVQTRWYRAPEIISGADYDSKSDVFSVGCILAEFYNGGNALFPGSSNENQLKKCVSLLGVPSQAAVARMSHEARQHFFGIVASCSQLDCMANIKTSRQLQVTDELLWGLTEAIKRQCDIQHLSVSLGHSNVSENGELEICFVVERFPQLGGREIMDTVIQKLQRGFELPSFEAACAVRVREVPPQHNAYQQLLFNCPPNVMDLLSHMLTFDPEERFTVEQSLQHPVFESFLEECDTPECPPIELNEEDSAVTVDDWKALVFQELQNEQYK